MSCQRRDERYVGLQVWCTQSLAPLRLRLEELGLRAFDFHCHKVLGREDRREEQRASKLSEFVALHHYHLKQELNCCQQLLHIDRVRSCSSGSLGMRLLWLLLL